MLSPAVAIVSYNRATASSPSSRQHAAAIREIRYPAGDDFGDHVRGDVRWGIIMGIRMGFIWGDRLERHPQRQWKSQRKPGVRGSAVIPDSLGHKRNNTSAGQRPASWRVGVSPDAGVSP